METARATQGFQRLVHRGDARLPIRLLNGSANAIVRAPRAWSRRRSCARPARSTELASLDLALGRPGHARPRHRRADGALGGVRHPHRRRDHDPAGAHRSASRPTTAPGRCIELARADRPLRASRCSTTTTPWSAPCTSSTPSRCRSRERPDHPGQAPDDPADRGARLAAARPAAGAAARRTGPARRRPRRVRRPGRHRHHRGRDRGDRRRHRRRARPARRPRPASAATARWSLSGLLRPDEVEDLTGIELPDHEDYDTVAGLVLQVLGRVPDARRRRRGARCPTAPTPTSPSASSSPCSPSSTWTACASTGSRCGCSTARPTGRHAGVDDA